MSSQGAVHASPVLGNTGSGKGALDTWRFHRQRGGRTQSPCVLSRTLAVERGCG